MATDENTFVSALGLRVCWHACMHVSVWVRCSHTTYPTLQHFTPVHMSCHFSTIRKPMKKRKRKTKTKENTATTTMSITILRRVAGMRFTFTCRCFVHREALRVSVWLIDPSLHSLPVYLALECQHIHTHTWAAMIIPLQLKRFTRCVRCKYKNFYWAFLCAFTAARNDTLWSPISALICVFVVQMRLRDDTHRWCSVQQSAVSNSV